MTAVMAPISTSSTLAGATLSSRRRAGSHRARQQDRPLHHRATVVQAPFSLIAGIISVLRFVLDEGQLVTPDVDPAIA